MRPWTVTALAAVVLASGAIAQSKEAYNLDAATEDLTVFHRLARDGVVKREDARAEVNFAPRFDDADADRDGVLTAAEMDQYIRRTYGVSAQSAGHATAEDAYRLHAATRDLEAFQQLARGGMVRRQDAEAHPYFGARFDQFDLNRDGMVTAQEMDGYVLGAYGIVSRMAAAGKGSASVGAGRKPAPAAANSGSASAGSGRR